MRSILQRYRKYTTGKVHKGKEYDGSQSSESKEEAFDELLSLFRQQCHDRQAENIRKSIVRSSKRHVTICVTFFLEGLQVVKEDLLTSAYSIFGLESPPCCHLGISKILKKCMFEYLRPEVVHWHPWKPTHERTPFSRMQPSILRAVRFTLVAMERDFSFP